jgi:hypothetical protein
VSALADAEAVVRAALAGAATATGADPSALERLPREPCSVPDGTVSSGWAAHVQVGDGEAALHAAAEHWDAAGWDVRRTPFAALASRDGVTVSLVLDAAGGGARLSGGTPCLPGTPDR